MTERAGRSGGGAEQRVAPPPTVRLDDEERAMLAGEHGPAARLAMRIVARMAVATGADRLIPVTRAHVDGCLYHGTVSLDFAERLRDGGGRVRVPTTLNVGSLDLLHPELFRGPEALRVAGRRLMQCYTALGCTPTWTCAPYQLRERPAFGEQVAWAESNAIVFANSVLGARTERYGDFIDVAAAITGRVPYVGLHRDDGRFGTVVFRLRGLSARLLASDVLFAALGHLVGTRAAGAIPVIEGLEQASEDQLKALGAAAASSGAVAMFHVVGVTPEARTLADALGGRAPARTIDVTADALRAAADELTSAAGDVLGAVSVGTPHFSLAEFTELRTLLAGRRVATRFYVSTGRDVLAEVAARGWMDELTACGVKVVTDTCTYVTPIMEPDVGTVMTNSGKWAWYAPNNLGIPVVFGSLGECVESAVVGRVVRDGSLWHD